ncbi:MAG: beta-galactosidase [Acidobacteriota bacterium]
MSISRRRLLQGISVVSSYAGLNGLRLTPLAAAAESMAAPTTGAPRFAKPEIIRYDAQCFTIHGRDTFLYSACVHYPRVPRELWRDRLTKLKQAGFNTIETYVFWNYHEPVEGQVDMSAFEDFIQAVHEAGMWLVARVGPYACAEWDSGGFPQWIIEKQFPLRSDSPESIRTSLNWYGHVLPVVQKNLITRGGPVILVQIENEYDFWKLPNQNKLNYLTALAQSAWSHGIDVPLLTNWGQQARENSDPVMAQIMDSCDFYPRWKISPEVDSGLAKLRKEEPMSPVSVAELQGGWFSNFGGLLSIDQVGVSGEQFNALVKTVIEQDTTFFSVYMGHGGTNFDWAARDLTTTYDYAAPVSEPGGLWDKYYAAHRLGAYLKTFGTLLSRAKTVPGGVSSDNHNVSASLRRNGEYGLLFVRETAEAPQAFTLKLSDGGENVQIPAEGKLSIASRGMKMMPVNLTLPDARISYCTAEVLMTGRMAQRSYVVVYDDPGSLVEIALHAEEAPAVEGELLYQRYDAANHRAVLGFRMEAVQKHLLIRGNLQIVALPRSLADRTWPAQLAAAHGGAPGETPVITDCVLMRDQQQENSGTTLTLEYAPGGHELTILEHVPVTQCTVDGKPVQVQREQRSRTASIAIQTPPLPAQPIVISSGESWVESFDLSQGRWITTDLVPLQRLGQLPYSYVKYRAAFDWNGEPNLALETWTEDHKQVFLNGARVADLSRRDGSLSCSLAGRAKKGANLLEISYECFSSPNFGPTMAELKGIRSVHLGDGAKRRQISSAHIQMASPAMNGRAVNPEFSSTPWCKTAVGPGTQAADFVPAYTWFRARFTTPATPAWFCPWKLAIASQRDALIYLNGKFVGFYRTIGPQEDFYLPEPYLHTDGKQENILTVRLAYTATAAPLERLVVAPYAEFAARRTEVRLQW